MKAVPRRCVQRCVLVTFFTNQPTGRFQEFGAESGRVYRLWVVGGGNLSHPGDILELAGRLTGARIGFQKDRTLMSDRFGIFIPTSLSDILRKDRALDGAVNTSLATFESWLRFSQLPLFPDFTDHGIQHLNDVISTADRLIGVKCRELLSPADIATLILAVLLHDLGMHITPEGLRSLITGASGHAPIAEFSDPSWDVLWKDFRALTSRFSGRENTALYGQAEPVRPPDLNNDEVWTENQCRLAGEFVRRHHAVLAHQIAVYGFPGVS